MAFLGSAYGARGCFWLGHTASTQTALGPGIWPLFASNENGADSSFFERFFFSLLYSFFAQAEDTRASFGRLDISGSSNLPPGAGLEAGRALAYFLFALILYFLPRKATK